jgi:methionine synthase II (cobalamin-independent)
MPLPTENVGSLPRPARLQAAIQDYDARKITLQQLALEPDAACLVSITRTVSTGAPTVSDGEQRASTFATYSRMDTSEGRGLAENLAQDGQYFACKSRVK